MNRKIVYLFDTIESKVVSLDVEISSKPKGFDKRYAYNTDRKRFLCVECSQVLVASHSSNDNVYFRHNPNTVFSKRLIVI